MRIEAVQLTVDGMPFIVGTGASVIAALAVAGMLCTRRSVTGEARFALCGMGHCQECRVTINGRAHQLACQRQCEPGMVIETGAGSSA